MIFYTYYNEFSIALNMKNYFYKDYFEKGDIVHIRRTKSTKRKIFNYLIKLKKMKRSRDNKTKMIN